MKKAILYGQKDSAVLEIGELLQEVGFRSQIIEKSPSITFGAVLRSYNYDYDILFAENPILLEKEFEELLQRIIYKGDIVVLLLTDEKTIKDPSTVNFLRIVGCTYTGQEKGVLQAISEEILSIMEEFAALIGFRTEQKHKFHCFNIDPPAVGIIGASSTSVTMAASFLGLGVVFIIGYDNLLRPKGFGFFARKKEEKALETEEIRNSILNAIFDTIGTHAKLLEKITSIETGKRHQLFNWVKGELPNYEDKIDTDFLRLRAAIDAISIGSIDGFHDGLQLIRGIRNLRHLEEPKRVYFQIFVEGGVKIANTEIKKRHRSFKNGYFILNSLTKPDFPITSF